MSSLSPVSLARNDSVRLCAIHQPHYLAWPRYFDKIARADVFVYLDDAEFTKNGWQNRNRLKGPHGAFLITVPVRQHSHQRIDQVVIAGDEWRRIHLQSLRTSYGRSPGYPRLAKALGDVLDRSWSSLADLDIAVTTTLLSLLGIDTPCVRSSTLGVTGAATQRLADLCRAVDATGYLSGAFAAGAYLEPEILRAQGLSLQYHDWQAPTYTQAHVKAGFIPELSVIDILASEADAAGIITRSGGVFEPPPEAAPTRPTTAST